MSDLLNVDDALQRILAAFSTLEAETVSLDASLGRILAHAIIADHPVPAFPNSSMDGYAFRADDLTNGVMAYPVTLHVVMDIPAGATPTGTLQPAEAARIMTGAMLPPGADTVIPMEATDQQWEAGDDAPLPKTITFHTAVKRGDYVRPMGEDIQTDDLVLEAGTRIRAAEIGILAALGYAQVEVIRQPRVAILTSGDELTAPGEPLTSGKIYDANSPAIAALVTTYGGVPLGIAPARDTFDDVRNRFQQAIDLQPDVIISTAGVSVGTFDVVRLVIESLGAINFWRINLRPGKPLAYGHVGGIPFFGLPGNPVSALVTFDVFVRSVLLTLSGQSDDSPTINAELGEDIRSDGRRSYIRVTLKKEQNRLIARSTGTQSSGALMSMVRADGLLILPENVMVAQAGDTYPVRLLKPLHDNPT